MEEVSAAAGPTVRFEEIGVDCTIPGGPGVPGVPGVPRGMVKAAPGGNHEVVEPKLGVGVVIVELKSMNKLRNGPSRVLHYQFLAKKQNNLLG